MIIWVTWVLRRTVAGDWRFDNPIIVCTCSVYIWLTKFQGKAIHFSFLGLLFWEMKVAYITKQIWISTRNRFRINQNHKSCQKLRCVINFFPFWVRRISLAITIKYLDCISSRSAITTCKHCGPTCPQDYSYNHNRSDKTWISYIWSLTIFFLTYFS